MEQWRRGPVPEGADGQDLFVREREDIHRLRWFGGIWDGVKYEYIDRDGAKRFCAILASIGPGDRVLSIRTDGEGFSDSVEERSFEWLHVGHKAAVPAAPAEAPLDNKRGAYRKFRVERTDGSSGPGGKHEHCEMWVLDFQHDPFSIPALRAYADACRAQYPALAADLDVKVQALESRAEASGTRGPAPDAASLATLADKVERGRAKFPGNRFMLPALIEEVGELARALLQRKGPEGVRAEALDVAAVALRIYEEGDATFDDITDEEAKP